MPFFFTLRYHCRGWYKFVDGFTRRAVQFPYHGQPHRSMFTIIIQNSSSKLLFQFLQWLFSSFIPSIPSPPLPSTPHTNSCKSTIWGASPFQHHTRWKPIGFVLEGMLWSKKFPSPKKDWDRHFGFWNPLWSGTFPLQKGPCILVFKMPDIFFFSFGTLWS